ncbi:MAG: sensor histidine kinase [Aliidiomarina sp.]|uniref:sensor histidine kinase n=1 Tax=Aliidiomarina sp. TaxID=1872439 RepID=UPI0025BA01CD|nr:sensor histidine kinase [Aliidiomarina sp.]MCH8500739.1 sensor histidine kinase [Aliidiomarina sp.]
MSTHIEQLPQKYSWVYLVNLVFFFIPFFVFPYSLVEAAVMLLGLGVFLWLYFTAYKSTQAMMFKYAVAIAALGFALLLMNPGAVALLVFSGFFFGYALPLQRYLLSVGALIVGVGLFGYIGPGNFHPFFLISMPVIAWISFFGWVEQKKMEQRRAKERTNQEIEYLAASVERERIARDLHDILGHTLSCLALKAELAEKLLAHGQVQDAQQHLSELSQTARDALTQVRQSVSGYKHDGLKNEVTRLRNRLADSGFKVTVEGDIPLLPAQLETVLVLALTELVTNVLRHSQGDACAIEFSQQAGHCVQVYDNGTAQTLDEGNGLQGVRERLRAFGGSLELAVTADGTAARIMLPLPATSTPEAP